MSEETSVTKRDQYVVVPDDHERFIPAEFVGAPIAPNFYCRFWNPKRTKYCGSIAGMGTTHSGRGRCRKHDGGSDKRTKHGLLNKYKVGNPTFAEAIERHASNPSLLDMRTELTIICGLLDEVLEKENFDRPAVERLAVEASRLKERIHNVTAKNAFTIDQAKRLFFGIDRIIDLRVEDAELATQIKLDILALGV